MEVRKVMNLLKNLFCIVLMLSVTIAGAESAGSKHTDPTNTPNAPFLVEPELAGELISVNFEQTDIRIVVKTISDITGINFIVDDDIHATITVMSPTKIRLGELYEVLESILEVKGYAAVPSGNLVKIVPRAKAARHNLRVRIGQNPGEIPQNDSFVTQIIPLHYADAEEVSRIIAPLLAAESHMATYKRTNSILITDTSSNIHRAAKVVQELDAPASKEDVTVIGLNYASAQVLSEQLTKMMQEIKFDSAPNGQDQKMVRIKAGVRILPNLRTNSLIVVANPTDTATIRRLVSELDIQRATRADNVHVMYLEHAPSEEAAKSLNKALSSLQITGALEAGQPVQVTADVGTNSLVITASPQDFEVIAEIADKLDIVREQVLVEMLIMEVSEDAVKEIGIDWGTLDEAVEGSIRGFATTNLGPRVEFLTGTLEGLAVGTFKRREDGTVGIGSIVQALEKVSGVNILSTPHILTSNHQSAQIIVGENVPFVTQSRITEEGDLLTPTVIQTFEYRDVGIILEITPHISQKGLIRLEVKSEFSKIVESVTGIEQTPTTATREAQTVVSMKSGATVAIGGLIRDDKVTLEKKIPLLGDMPLVGGLFKFNRDRLQKTNLLLFITPYCLSTQTELDRITEKKKSEMAPAMKEQAKTAEEDKS